MKNLSCIYTNADTLTNEMPKLKAHVEYHNPWIIAVTEIISKNNQINHHQLLYRPRMYLKQRQRHNNPNT